MLKQANLDELTRRMMGQMNFGSRKVASWLLVLCALVLAPGAASAQDYKLGPDDVISVTVLRHPEASVAGITIPSTGRIQLPVVGEIFVAGKTTSQVQSQVIKALRVRYRRPNVTVSLLKQRERRVFVSGAVNKPGVLELRPGWRLSEALAAVAGLTARADQIEGTLSRGQQKPIKLDLAHVLSSAEHPANIILQPGDVLRFTERVIPVTIVGQVTRAGSYNIPIGSSIVEAIAVAGHTPKAALTKVSVRRADGTEIPLDLYRAIVMGEGKPDFKLQAGDLITIPEATARISIGGAVAKPGFYDIEDGKVLRVRDAVTRAGYLPNASLARAKVQRANGTEVNVDLYKILTLGLDDDNLLLNAGDSIYIPELRGVTVLGQVGAPGHYFLQEGQAPRVTDVLARTGSVSAKPEMIRIRIARPAADGQSGGMKNIDIDPVALLNSRDPKENVLVQDGDLITVSAINLQMVYVTGEVKGQGAFELKENSTVPELIARAGGPTEAASLKHVVVQRGDKTYPLDLLAAVKQGKPSDFKLQEGDRVVVSENTAKVMVTAAVNRPGFVLIPEDKKLTVAEALTAAGGPRERARLWQVALMRQTTGGEVLTEIIPMNTPQSWQMAANIPMRHGDVLYVPEGKQSSGFFQKLTQGAGLLSLFGGFLR